MFNQENQSQQSQFLHKSLNEDSVETDSAFYVEDMHYEVQTHIPTHKHTHDTRITHTHVIHTHTHTGSLVGEF